MTATAGFSKIRIGIVLLVLLLSALSFLLFQRLHFSHQNFPGLAKRQWKITAPPRTPQIIGHRGSGLKSTNSRHTTGNTVNAIRTGIAAGCDWIEIDIRATRDRHIVVFHDEKIDQKTNGAGSLSSLSLDEVRSVDILVEPKEKIRTLEEILSHFDDPKLKWVFDIKTPGLRDSLLQTLASRVSKENAILFGEYSILQEYQNSGFALGYTVLGKSWKNRFRVLFRPGSILDRADSLNCRYLVLPILFTSQPLIDAAQSRDIHVWSYGSDDPVDAMHSAGRGISGLIVDHPEPHRTLFGPKLYPVE
ncbi:MAG: glycerophosphodiester phosphodiesterase family protein [Verrucomicrobiales bacterium]|nr:glycerophosphodiester phosphodiesterase family protein [Verrucomicrobiales bacterium]